MDRKKHMRRHPRLLVICTTQPKLTMRQTPMRMAQIRNTTLSADKNVQGLERTYTAVGHIRCYNRLGNQLEIS